MLQDKWFEYTDFDNVLTNRQTQTITIKRKTVIRGTGGDYITKPEDLATVGTIKVSIQTEDTRFTKFEPAVRDIQRLWLFTKDLALIVRKGDLASIDLISVTGESGVFEDFEVEGIEPHPHHRKIIVRSLAVSGAFDKPVF